MESGKNLRCVKIGVGPTLGLGQNWHLPKIVVLLTLAFSQNFLLNYLMPNFYQYSKFTSKHIISVKVDFAVDLACFHQLGPLGRVGLRVAMSVCVFVCLCVILCHRVQFFSRPLIGPQIT